MGTTGFRPRVGVIGAGRVGTAMAYVLQHAGYRLSGCVSRTDHSARRFAEITGSGAMTAGALVASSDIIIIATTDRAISLVAQDIAGQSEDLRAKMFFHCSGALSSELLSCLAARGASTGSLHPLQTFPDLETAVRTIPGSFFCLEGRGAALEVGRVMVEDIGGKLISILPGDKPHYHACAMMASGYVVTLIDAAVRGLGAIGVSSEQALAALLPLVRGAVAGIESVGTRQALTGPIARGDWEVVHRHVESVKAKNPELLSLYRAVGLHSATIASEAGAVDRTMIERIRRELE